MMKFRYSCFLGIAAYAFGMGSLQADTLNDALVKAYLNNPSLKSQRANVRATDEGVSQAMANWRPAVTWTGSASRARNENSVRARDEQSQTISPLNSTFNVTQPLFRGFRTHAAIEQAESNVSANRWRLKDAEQTILLNAVTAYSNVVRDEAVLELNRNNEEVLRRQLEATQDRFEVGELTRTDVSQAQARLAGATADRIQAEGDLEVSRASYQNIIGMVPTDLSVPSLPADLPKNVNESVARAMSGNPTLLAASYDEQASIDGIEETSGQLLPEINLVASSTTSLDSTSENTRTEDNRIGFNVSVPFYQQGAVYSQVRQAKQVAAQRRMDMEQARRDAIESAHSSWENLTTARARIQSFLAQIEAAEVALDGVQREASVGSRTVLDVLDAEQELLDAKVSLVRAERDQLVAVYRVKQSVGTLTAEKLGLDAAIYDPTVHYNEVKDIWMGTSSVGDIDDFTKSGKN